MDAIHCRAESPFRPVDWRWRRAALAVADPAIAGRGGFDPWTARAVQYLKLSGAGAGPAAAGAPAAPDPDVRGACDFRALGDVPARWELEARLLAGEGDHAVAARFGVAPGAVAAYEALYFHVRDRLDAPSYITHFAIGPAAARGPLPHELDVLWKLFGYHGGPLVLDAVVAPFAGLDRPGGRADLPGYFAAVAGACLRRAAAVASVTLRVTRRNAKAILRLRLDPETPGAGRREGRAGGGLAPDVTPNLRAFSEVVALQFGAALRGAGPRPGAPAPGGDAGPAAARPS